MTDFFSDERWLAHQRGDVLAGLDFEPACDSCGFVPASSYIHWHPVNQCGWHKNRRQELLVCDCCLEEIENKSVLILSELQAWAWLLPWKKSECNTCGRVLQLPSDILEVVRSLT